MKLFTKTLLFFISVILFQSSLTIFLTANITKRDNQKDAAKELKQEATIVFENYASWKRGIWKSLIEIQNDAQLAAILQQNSSSLSSSSLTRYLKDILLVAGIDIFVLKKSLHSSTEIIPITYNNFSLFDLQELQHRKTHPYLELRIIGSQLCLVGITRLPMGPLPESSAYLDIFLIKRVDGDFCHQLALNRSAQTAFFLDAAYVSGTLDERTLARILESAAFPDLVSDYYAIESEEQGYNVAVQKIEHLHLLEEGEQTLVLVTILSNIPYIRRLSILEQTMLSVTALSALLTVILSLFLSRHITHPIKHLRSAMHRIRKGKYNTSLAIHSRSEIGELLQGFNEMARKIRQDKETMEEYIYEITVLKDYNEKIIQSIRAGILIISHTLTIEKVNSSFLGYFPLQEEQLVGHPLQEAALDILDAPLLANIHAILRQEEEEYTTTTRTRDNKVYEIKLYPIDSHSEAEPDLKEVVGCVCVVQDVSRRRELEEKIFQAEKLSSISMLSAGVAHEINNPLGSIMTNVQNLIEEEQDAERGVALGWIEQETRRIARIVQKLLEFSSSDLDNIQGSEVEKIITEMITLITYSLKKTQHIEILTELAGNLPPISMSEDEFKQTIINLVKNSIQAIEDNGTIVITTQKHAQEDVILISIEDDGIGIPEENISRIFDPFYTTKHNGEGTGLGLSVVYGIMTKYHGTITVQSQEHAGTRIHLAIPVLDRAAKIYD